ncbi:GGDEF domain-containing protein [Shewanella psychrophila]|uniref:GGDEF domain-containing protein n=1 Tax=Shewanella psychrophila TaxID=225848 RepID=UPI001F00CD40|nr:GGDEF domain-containing protein [Shewanella psychrophila]
MSWLLFILLSPLVSADEPNNLNTTFEELESGVTLSSDDLKAKLEYLKANITLADLKDYLRLQRVLCWSTDAYDNNERAKGLALAQKQLNAEVIKQSPETLADIKLCRAWFYQVGGQVDLALKEYNQVIAQAYQLESPRLIADARGLRGAIYSFQGNYALALEDLYSAQHLYDGLNLAFWSRYNLAEIATSYRRFGDPQTAYEYYAKLEAKFIESGDLESANGMVTEMAIALEELGENEAALEKYQQSYRYWQLEKDELAQSFVGINLAGTLIKLGRLDEALKYLEASHNHVMPTDEAFYSFMMLFRAKIEMLRGRPNAAIPLIEEAKSAFLRVKNSRGLIQLYTLESQIFAELSQWEQAYRSLEHYNRLHSELDIKLQTHRTTEMQTRFNTKQVESENLLLLETQQIKEHELQILQQNRYLQFTVIFLAIIVIIIISFFAYKQAQKSKLLSVLALTDHLTQLANRRHAYTVGEQSFSDNHDVMALILFDADHFKKINDNFGHDLGDKVLTSLANISSSLMRKSDLVGRVGGEEFLVILPHTNLEQATEIAERLVDSIAMADLSGTAQDLTITISAGVAAREQDKSFSELLQRADKGLYLAKSSGRNCVKIG